MISCINKLKNSYWLWGAVCPCKKIISSQATISRCIHTPLNEIHVEELCVNRSYLNLILETQPNPFNCTYQYNPPCQCGWCILPGKRGGQIQGPGHYVKYIGVSLFWQILCAIYFSFTYISFINVMSAGIHYVVTWHSLVI